MIILLPVVITVVMDVHNCLNRIIQAMNPATASRRAAALYQVCRFAVGEVAVGRFPQN